MSDIRYSVDIRASSTYSVMEVFSMTDYLNRLTSQLRDCQKTAEACPGVEAEAARHRAEGLRLALQIYRDVTGDLPADVQAVLNHQIMLEMSLEPRD